MKLLLIFALFSALAIASDNDVTHRQYLDGQSLLRLMFVEGWDPGLYEDLYELIS